MAGRDSQGKRCTEKEMEFLAVTEWLTLTEAAQYLKIQPRTLALWVRQKKVPAHRLSGVRRCVYRFLRNELDAMLTSASAAIQGGINAAE
jgi:excisionase family DNA binding protein